MAFFSIPHLKIAGLAASVPRNAAHISDLQWMGEREQARFVKTVGIESRRLAPEGMTAADLCFAAAEKLLAALNWDAADIDALMFVSQTPDQSIPGSATQLQQRLGLKKSALSLDVCQGCAGYVYGLASLGALQSVGRMKKALLLVGDTITHLLAPDDSATVPIFSDAGSATAIEFEEGASAMHFNLQSDGAGFEAIHQAAEPGAFMRMQGLEVFNFALREVAPNIRSLVDLAQIDLDWADAYVFHQANLLLNESIRKKLRIAPEKVPYTLSRYGNTSCATIPVTLVDQLGPELRETGKKLVLTGFGVGLSWGSVCLETSSMIVPEMIEL